jgi:hypothetical protein
MAGIRYDSNVITSAKNVPIGVDAPVYTVPYGSVAVYVYGTPPETLASLFADQNLTQAIANPLQTDSEGRFGFWVTAGVYTYTVTSATGVELGSYAVTLTSPVGPPGTIQVGEVTGGPSAVVTNVGTGTAAILDFTLPQGPQGVTGATGAIGATGPPGTNGTNGVASLPQLAALRTKQPVGPNLYNPATLIAGYYVSRIDGTLAVDAGYNATDFIPANSGGMMTTSVQVTNDGNSGIAEYDGNFAFVGGISTSTAAGGSFMASPAAAYVKLTFKSNDIAAAVGPAMVVAGTGLPNPPQAFGTYATNTIDSKIAAQMSYSVTAAQTAVAAALPLVTNLFDKNRITVGGYNTTTHAIDPTLTTLYVSGNIPVIAGQSYTMAHGTEGAASPTIGGAWLDANEKVISTTPTPETDGEVFTAPANAVYYLFTGTLTGLSGGPAAQMFTLGPNVPPFYLPFSQSAPTPTSATYSTGNGKNIGVLGDSFSAWFNNEWQNIVLARTGANQTFQDSRGKRQWLQALECYGTITPGGALSTYSTTYPFIDQANFAFNLTGRAPQISTVGNTLAQNIATTDLLIIELGENDDQANEPIGAPGDAVSAGTLYGNMRWVVEAYLTAKPTLRIVMIGPEYQTGTGSTLASQIAVNNAQKTFAQSYAIPYLDLFNVGGSAPFTNATYTRGDGTHPSDWNFQNVYSPAVGNFIQQWL